MVTNDSNFTTYCVPLGTRSISIAQPTYLLTHVSTGSFDCSIYKAVCYGRFRVAFYPQLLLCCSSAFVRFLFDFVKQFLRALEIQTKNLNFYYLTNFQRSPI